MAVSEVGQDPGKPHLPEGVARGVLIAHEARRSDDPIARRGGRGDRPQQEVVGLI